MDVPKSCWCWLQIGFYTKLPVPNAVYRCGPQSKVIQRPMPGSRELQGLLGTSLDRESGCRFPPRPREDMPHQFLYFTIHSSPSGDSSSSLAISWLPSCPCSLLNSLQQQPQHNTQNHSHQLLCKNKPKARCLALLTGRSDWRLWLTIEAWVTRAPPLGLQCA